MQRQGAKTEAMALLSEYKAELEKASRQKRQADPRQAKPADPRAAADPRQKLQEAEKRPQDPRQAARQQLTEAKVEAGANKRVAEAQIADPRQKQAKVAKHGKQADLICIDDEDDAGKDDEPDVEVVPEHLARAKILQGLPSLGFSE